jgi:hypothetical protein
LSGINLRSGYVSGEAENPSLPHLQDNRAS